MKQQYLIAALLAGMFCASQAQAQMAIAADVGTTGVGAHLSVPLQSKLNARFGIGFLNYSYDSSTDDVDYKLKLKLRTFDALLDYFPMDGAFRLSAGVVYNGNKIDAKGKPNKNGEYPKGTVNYAVQKGLEHYYKCYVRYARETHGCLGK